MKSCVLLVGIIIAPLVGVALAQAPDRPKSQASDATSKPAAEPEAAGGAAKEHRWLKQLAGDWKIAGKLTLAPGQPPIESTGTEKARALGDYWIVIDGQSTVMGTLIHSLMTLGYDPAKSRFIGTWIDSTGDYQWRLEGTLDASDKVLTLTAEGPSMEDPTKRTTYRDVIEIKGANHRIMTSSVKALDGTWRTFGTAEKKRVE